MNGKQITVWVVIVIVVGVAAFFGGAAYGKGKAMTGMAGGSMTMTSGTGAPSAAGRAAGSGRYAGGAGARGTAGGAGGAGFGGGISGQIVSMDSSSITVKSANGSSSIVYFSSTTPITKQATATSADLTTGADVVVRGSSSNGTVTATNISIVPSLPTAPTGTGTGAAAPAAATPAAQ